MLQGVVGVCASPVMTLMDDAGACRRGVRRAGVRVRTGRFLVDGRLQAGAECPPQSIPLDLAPGDRLV